IRQLIHGIAINYVYTPEEFRGKGYAAANIYYMCKNYLENGNDFCSLFVDKKNPLSARSYEKIGFQFLEDNYEYAILI
ncbi:MAG TPA: GNAT family N-acetyltransferase, partial [Mobilitalea sp.]|nr:GNAT family N-acetyltransferase [Mobilitalea sp.]